jgi:uncharacterized membrane protein
MDEPIVSPQASAGLADNQAGALAYITIIPAILFLILEPYNKRPFVRFNAFQCLCLAGAGFVLSFIAGVIPFLGWFILAPLVGLAMLVSVILCIYKAYTGTKFKLPIIGNFAENLAAK